VTDWTEIPPDQLEQSEREHETQLDAVNAFLHLGRAIDDLSYEMTVGRQIVGEVVELARKSDIGIATDGALRLLDRKIRAKAAAHVIRAAQRLGHGELGLMVLLLCEKRLQRMPPADRQKTAQELRKIGDLFSRAADRASS